MKNFWISFVALEAVLVVCLVAVPSAEAARFKPQNPEEYTNFLLSPEYSQWMVGPIGYMASEEERKAYLSLQEDDAAASFIDGFWEKRGGEAVFPIKGQKVLFDERREEADRLFDEGTQRGFRTDRGTVFVLYGEPEEIRFEAAPRGRGEFLELWKYSKDAEEGLDGSKPERLYYFVKKDGRTTHYQGPKGRQVPRTDIRN